jgi:hypothetical protein
MEEALSFCRAYEFWIYALLALGGLVYIRRFILSWEELRGAAFGLEREAAQARLNQSASLVVLLLAMAVGEFILVSFVVPAYPGANPLHTPTVDLLATPTTTLAAEAPAGPLADQAASLETTAASSPPAGEGCIPDQVMLTEPADGAEVREIVTLKGTATMQNFAFYKYEIQRPGDPIWLTVFAGKTPVRDGELGQWNTNTLNTGDYLLRLVVTDNQGQSLPPCVIRVRVNNPVGP